MKIRLLSISIIAFCTMGWPAQVPADPPVMLQYFEAEWDTMSYRMPDVFLAGYDSVWLPPPEKGDGGTSSIGYNLFDRFDLGSDASPTRYGTESEFRLMVDNYHRASCRVFVDWLMNHNAARDNWTTGFLAQGGYPGFVLQIQDGDAYGDFHTWDPNTQCPQSHNPGAGCYNLYDGRLLGLIDIDQAKSHNYIRHPVAAGDPNNIPAPAGAVYNQPNANNYRLYPDRGLAGYTPPNPGTDRNPSPPLYTFYPYNTASPMAGDPVTESATFLLLRSTQYYVEVLKVDGFRLDAAKHIPSWFWDNLWDAAVYNRYTGFDGRAQIPYSFSEAVESNGNMVNWVRKPGGQYGAGGWPAVGYDFGNRDALDLNEAGQLRDLVSSGGTHSWDDVMNASVDNVDGYQNGTIGVHHVNSHDNATASDDTIAEAYVLLRTGPCNVYHNALQFSPPPTFPQQTSRRDALGLGDDYITKLVRIRHQYGRGWFMPRNSNHADVLAFTRQTPSGEDNVLVGLNDSQSNGYDSVTITTAFPSGTRLHELTGNAADAVVDPTSVIPELYTVGGGGTVSDLRVPRNKNVNGIFHGRGYVVYGPAVPTGALSITNASTTVAPPDTAGTPEYRRRLNPVTIVNSSSFDILLQTQQADASDPNTDDLAIFRIDSGFKDYNGNGSQYGGAPSSDYNPGNTDSNSPSYGFENFLTQSSPRYGGGTGTYRQTIDAAALGEGYHYITVRAYRHRSGTADPLFGEFRLAIYVDAEEPNFELSAPTHTCNGDVTGLPVDFVVQAADSSVDRVYVFVDLQATYDFVGAVLGGLAEGQRASRSVDTFTFRRSALVSGNHRVDVVGVETLPNGQARTRHKSYTGIQSTTGAGLGAGDTNGDGTRNGKDVQNFLWYVTGYNPTFGPAADMNCDGVVDLADLPDFVEGLLGG